MWLFLTETKKQGDFILKSRARKPQPRFDLGHF